MLIKNEETDGLYGFGAVSREANTAQLRRNTHMLSLFAAALSTAVIAVMIALLPISTAAASPFFDNIATSADNIGIAAMAAFLLSTTVCAIMLIAAVTRPRKCRRRWSV